MKRKQTLIRKARTRIKAKRLRKTKAQNGEELLGYYALVRFMDTPAILEPLPKRRKRQMPCVGWTGWIMRMGESIIYGTLSLQGEGNILKLQKVWDM